MLWWGSFGCGLVKGGGSGVGGCEMNKISVCVMTSIASDLERCVNDVLRFLESTYILILTFPCCLSVCLVSTR